MTDDRIVWNSYSGRYNSNNRTNLICCIYPLLTI